MLAFAIAVAAWYGGGAAASLAVICSCLACAYFFMEPFYSFAITSDELALFALLLLFGTVIGWFGTVRRRAEEELGERARLLALTHDEERDLVKSYKLGVNAYVVKPVEFHEFVNAVKKLGVFWAVINEPPPGSVRTK
jgi:K+-sensing histidine kinase KdpD